jgi:hypothetical protein
MLYYNNCILNVLKLDIDKLQIELQQNTSKLRYRSYKTPKFKTTYISIIVLA